MRLADWDRVGRAEAAWFYRGFGLALVSNVLFEAYAGVWRVHTGELYPWHHIPVLPLYGTLGLACEWASTCAAGAMLIAQVGASWAARLAAVVTFVSLSQRFSNHGALMFIVALFVALSPPDVRAADLEEREHPNIGLVRAQLCIVYFFSAANKVAHGFLGGSSLQNLLGVPAALARPLSFAVVAAELALPILVFVFPRVGLVGVVLLHASFAAVLSGLWSFGLTMISMAALFQVPSSRSASRRR